MESERNYVLAYREGILESSQATVLCFTVLRKNTLLGIQLPIKMAFQNERSRKSTQELEKLRIIVAKGFKYND